MKNKKYIIGFIIILVLIVAIVLLIRDKQNSNLPEIEVIEQPKEVIPAHYVETVEDGTLKNVSEKLKEVKEIDGLKVSNVQIIAKDKEAVISINLENTSEQAHGGKDVTFIMKDEQENEIGKVGLYIDRVEAQKSIGLEINTDFSLINTYDFSILQQALSFD